MFSWLGPTERFLLENALGMELTKGTPTWFEIELLASRLYAGTMSGVIPGYVIGAGIGTAITYSIWGKEGAKHALEFYTGQGDSEYFNITGNASKILNHYF